MRLRSAWYSLFLHLLALNPSYPDSYISLISRAPPSFPVPRNLFLSHFKFLFFPFSLLPLPFPSLFNPFIILPRRCSFETPFIEQPRRTKRSFYSHQHHSSISLFITCVVRLWHTFSFGRYHTLILPLITFTNASSMTTNS